MQSTVLTPSKSTESKAARPSALWWLLGILLLCLCIIIQMPAAWLINQFMPNSSYLQQVSGNIWQGSAVTQVPVQYSNAKSNQPLMATVTWKLKPLSLFLGKLSADVDINLGQTRLDGQLSRGLNSVAVSDLSGKIDKQTLASIVSWNLPDAPIQVNALSGTLHESKGLIDVDGQLTWTGGELGYPNGGQVYRINLPAMRADLTQETRNDAQVIHANLVDGNSKRLGDIYLDANGMIDVGLTQRLLENMLNYKGNAAADTTVVNVRQPLLGGLNNKGAN